MLAAARLPGARTVWNSTAQLPQDPTETVPTHPVTQGWGSQSTSVTSCTQVVPCSPFPWLSSASSGVHMLSLSPMRISVTRMVREDRLFWKADSQTTLKEIPLQIQSSNLFTKETEGSKTTKLSHSLNLLFLLPALSCFAT